MLFVVVTALAESGPTETFFRENDEAIVYTYQAEVERKGAISILPVASSFVAFVEYEKAAYAKDRRHCDEMEKRGDIFSVESGTRCQVVREGGMSVGPIVRSAQEIRLLNGHYKGKSGWIVAKHLRKYSRIKIEPPERYTDENWDTPRPLALAFQAQDKVVYRELRAAQDKASAAARALPKGNRQRQVRNRVFRREYQTVLDRYDLDEATALRILDWGKQGQWPSQDHKDVVETGQ
jgi:hypothetical protein